jgi:hypothetical protein
MVFKSDLTKKAVAIYYFVPEGSKNGKDVFMPVDKVDFKKFKHPLIRLEFEGPPLVKGNRYMLRMTHDKGNYKREFIAKPVSRHVHEDSDDSIREDIKKHLKITSHKNFDASLQKDIRNYLKIAREFIESQKCQSD